MLGYSAIVNPETVMDWKSKELPKIIDRYQPKDMLNVDETELFCNLQSSMTLTYEGGSCHGGTKSKQRVTVVMGFNIDDREITSTGDWQVQQTLLLQKCKKLPTKYTANSNTWMTSATFEEFLV